jgi:hypothetical protein
MMRWNILLTIHDQKIGLEHVRIFRAKAAKLFNVDLCDLSDLFNEYGYAEVNAL